MNPCDPTPWRDPQIMRKLLDRIAATVTRPWNIMEVCGGQTWTLARHRLEELLPDGLNMIHGPGCPVCVTPAETIDDAIGLAMRPDVIFCSFGDMLRVPGTDGSLLRAKTAGADVRLLYSPLDTLDIAVENPDRQVIFFAIGFETTTPVYALMAEKARERHISNLSILTSLFTVPAAVSAIKSDPDCRIDALLAAGHVCAVTGLDPYRQLASDLDMPIVVTGFEPVDMLLGILRAVTMLENGRSGLSNAYGRAVGEAGAANARAAVDRVFHLADTSWRGMGIMPLSGMKLRPEFEQFDARRRFVSDREHVSVTNRDYPDSCIAHLIMKGLRRPAGCPHFGKKCTPACPVGAPMVSSEGVCAAHYRYLS